MSGPAAMVRDKDAGSLGTMLVVASAAALSTAGLFTQLVKLDVWTMLFWRGIFAGLFIAGFLVLRHRRRLVAALWATGRAGLLAALCSTLATICFINALRLTAVADVMIIGATAPFFTAPLAWFFTGERDSRTTLAASAVALVGVGLMVGAAASAGDIRGDLLALMMTILIAATMVIIRANRHTSLLGVPCLTAFLCALVVLPVAHPAAATRADLVYLVLFGTTQFGLGMLLLTLGTRLVSATRSALIGSLEVPLASLWVWLAFAEQPSLMACVGGGVVMAAVVGDLMLTPRARSVATS